ncbi:hypothetical protein BDK63_003140 [Halomonas campaniensis]|uniref:site-specific DNA-methyltransferase (adenine-specific) n=1 Tax=Halomonas campaniensis TaxID=213554 RepID=A0A7W5K5G7_9GAMM|nr:DNA methyltransferase [Halomonas campaniensis]MBB3332246.1 hypothetical protein [Halomonas campaniensis]
MQPLDKTLRNRLDRTVRKARPVAEQAAQAALEQLGVGEETPPSYLSDDQRALRRRLRAHARSLGDPLKEGAQAVTRLIGEIAYEHWHRMLFARFLAENELLMYDGVAVTLEECEELAEEEGHASGWALAARLASTMLPQVFRVDSPVFELTLAAEYQRELEELLAGLPVEVFHASDSLGWVYQFWQTDNKERINRSEVKIGADELPAVTQLFTEPYMVSFLLDNSLGAWWAARRLSETDLANAESEQELRDKASLPGVRLEYLRFVKDEETGHWTPAAGTFDAWPQSLAELKTLDPCCGSGHFLVAALLMLVPMRMELEGLSARDSVDAVLRDNLHGLEIDQRCVELAAFALALTAWRYPDAGGYRKLPELHLACSGLSISVNKQEWLELAGDDVNLKMALEELYNQFKSSSVLGSLIKPERSLRKGSLFEFKWEDVEPLLEKAIEGKDSYEKSELGVVARGIYKAATILSGRYSITATNVPYLSINRVNPSLRSFIESNYKNAKNDLAFVFMKRLFELAEEHGLCCFVTTSGWTFQNRERHFRNEILESYSLRILARLGAGAFDTISGEVVQAMLGVVSKADKLDAFCTIDADNGMGADYKAESIKKQNVVMVDQKEIVGSSSTVINFAKKSNEKPVGDYAEALRGLSTGEVNWFNRFFWEVEVPSERWDYFQSDTEKTTPYGGREQVILWESECGVISRIAEQLKHLNHAIQSWRRGKPNWGRKGVAVNLMGGLHATIYNGEKYSANIGVLVPNDPSDLGALWQYCSSKEFVSSVRSFNKKISVEPRYFEKALVDFDEWRKSSKNIKLVAKPYAVDPTQWIFHGHPCGSVIWDDEANRAAQGPLRTDESVLQVAVARLLGYRWPAELDAEMELAEAQRDWAKHSEGLLGHADRDGIVCLPAVRGERRAVDRLEALLAEAYGDQWSSTTRGKLLESVGHAGKNLESWLRDKFFAQHCKLFQNRPFIWHVWDGLKDGFSALVNYHKLDYKTLETLTYTYLGDWIYQQKKQINEGIEGAEGRLAAAEALQNSLELILEGEDPYDIFVRWKPLEEQPIGWNPDLDDGVRLNIRPFLSVPDVKKKGAGVLVHKPNIHWKKDRGKDVESAPWYHLGPQLGEAKGARINDYHLTLAAKRKAQEKKDV